MFFLHHAKFHRFRMFRSKITWKNVIKIVTRVTLFCDIFSLTFDSTVNCIKKTIHVQSNGELQLKYSIKAVGK